MSVLDKAMVCLSREQYTLLTLIIPSMYHVFHAILSPQLNSYSKELYQSKHKTQYSGVSITEDTISVFSY